MDRQAQYFLESMPLSTIAAVKFANVLGLVVELSGLEANDRIMVGNPVGIAVNV